MLGPGVGQSLPRLVRRFGPVCAQALYRATLQAVNDVGELIENERIECELEMGGQLVVARGRRGRSRLARLATELERLELPHEQLDDEALRRRIRLAPESIPAIAKDFPAAVRLPIAGTLHPVRFLHGLANAIEARNGTIFEQSRVVSVGRNRPARLPIASGGEVIADNVVVATSGYTPALGLLRGRVLPIHLNVLATEPLDAAAHESIGWKGREGVLDSRRIFNYFRLSPDDRIVFGGGAPRYHWGGHPDEDSCAAPVMERLVEDLHRTFPSDVALNVQRVWTGLIGYTLDGLPAICRSRSHPSVVQAVGWCGHGVALAIGSGAWIADILCDGAVPEDLPWFRDRPPLVPMELSRWLGVQLSVKGNAWMDRWG